MNRFNYTVVRSTFIVILLLFVGLSPAVAVAQERTVESPDTFNLISDQESIVIIAEKGGMSFGEKWKQLYKRKFRVRPLGFTVGYTMKWFSYKENGEGHNFNFFGHRGFMNGVMFGIPYQPHYYWGLGLDTGVFGEVYSCKDSRNYYRVEDIGMYVPVRAMYRVPFKEDLSAYFTTGVSFDLGIRMNLKIADDTSAGTQKLDYNRDTPRRFNTYYEIGGGFRALGFQFSVIYSLGMTRNYHFLSTNGMGDNYIPVRSRRLTFSAALLF